MKIMSSVSGYSGESITLLAFADPETGILVIVKKADQFEPEALEGFAFVTNLRAESYDCLFKEEHLAQAIRDFVVGMGEETVSLGESAARYKPRIETDGVDESGQKYRLHDDMTNAEIAVLALVHFHMRQKAIGNADSLTDDLYDWITV